MKLKKYFNFFLLMILSFASESFTNTPTDAEQIHNLSQAQLVEAYTKVQEKFNNGLKGLDKENYSNYCNQSWESKAPVLGGCFCSKSFEDGKFSVDFGVCVSALKAIKNKEAFINTTKTGLQASSQIYGQEVQKDLNTKIKNNEDPSNMAFDASIITSAATAVTAQSIVTAYSSGIKVLKDVLQNWVYPQTFEEQCEKYFDGARIAVTPPPPTTTGGPANFISCNQVYQQLIKSSAPFRNSILLDALHQKIAEYEAEKAKYKQLIASSILNGVKTNIAKNEYQGATASNSTVDSNYFCAQNPTMEGCEDLVRDPIISTGGGHNSINLSNPGVRLASSGDSGDDFSAESSLGGSVVSNDSVEDFESNPQGITAKFVASKGAGASGGSGAPGASANGGGPGQNDPRQNQIDRQAADEKKPLIAGKINARQSNKKKKGFSGSSFFPTSRNDDQKDALANSGNPFEGLFGNSNKTKKEVMRGLASDGVALKSDGPSVSIFRRITKVHRRKYQKNQLLKSL